jgi:hypothetical protein
MADVRGPREPVPNETIPWTEVPLRGIVPGLDVVPFGLWYYGVKSSSPDSEQFIHDPLAAMIDEEHGVTGVTPKSKVTTLVINHDKTLYYTQLHSLAVVGPDGNVTLVQWKQAP